MSENVSSPTDAANFIYSQFGASKQQQQQQPTNNINNRSYFQQSDFCGTIEEPKKDYSFNALKNYRPLQQQQQYTIPTMISTLASRSISLLSKRALSTPATSRGKFLCFNDLLFVYLTNLRPLYHPCKKPHRRRLLPWPNSMRNTSKIKPILNPKRPKLRGIARESPPLILMPCMLLPLPSPTPSSQTTRPRWPHWIPHT